MKGEDVSIGCPKVVSATVGCVGVDSKVVSVGVDSGS